jgi:hypothetical protein
MTAKERVLSFATLVVGIEATLGLNALQNAKLNKTREKNFSQAKFKRHSFIISECK